MIRKTTVLLFLVTFIIGITVLELTGKSKVSDSVVAKVSQHIDAGTFRDLKLPGFMSRPSNASPGSYCKWEFSHYESSEYEEEWFRLIPQAQKHICEVVAHHAQQSKDIVSRVEELKAIDSKVKWPTVDSELPSPLDPRDAYMSKMHYKRSCYDSSSDTFVPATGRGIQLIEPLWGMLRDPFDIFCQDLKLTMDTWNSQHSSQSKEHIMPQGFAPYAYDKSATSDEALTVWRTHGMPPWQRSLRPIIDRDVGLTFAPPRTIHLDLGSSYFGGWGVKSDNSASGQWFYDTYHQRGNTFDQFTAVEVESLNDTRVYQEVPHDLIGKYTFINTGLTMDKGDKLNTLDMIRRMVNPEDFLVFKLDIDSAPIEEPIVQSLLADDPNNGGVSALIDEFMFEHHVKYEPLSPYWGLMGTPEDQVGSLHDSYNLFRDLRRKGIRAHSWP